MQYSTNSCCNAFERSLALHLRINNRFELHENNAKNFIFKSNGVMYVASYRSNVPFDCDYYVMKIFAIQINKRLRKILALWQLMFKTTGYLQDNFSECSNKPFTWFTQKCSTPLLWCKKGISVSNFGLSGKGFPEVQLTTKFHIS